MAATLSIDAKEMYLMLCGWVKTQNASTYPYAYYDAPNGFFTTDLDKAFKAQKRADKAR